jgi:hypothetical protein
MSDKNLKILEDYISSTQPYSLILSGSYAIGKTHFLKSEGIKRIESIINERTGKSYKPIYVSLFGIQNLAQLESQILLSILPLKKGITENTLRVLKPMSRVGLGLLGVKGYDALISDVNDVFKKVPSLKNLVLVLDDVDRKHKDLSLKELFGFLNNLVENEGSKAIIVAEESNLSVEEDSIEWSKVIEKVSIRARYIPKTKEAVIDIIEGCQDSVCQHFILSKVDCLVEICESNGSNLRNLKYAIEKYRIVFNQILNSFHNDESFKEFKDTVLEQILVFTYATCIEYREGRINSTNLKEVLQEMTESYIDPELVKQILDGLHNDQNIEGVEEVQPENKFEKADFMTKYYKGNDWQFRLYESILLYVSNHDELDSKRLGTELSKTLYDLSNDNQPQYKLIQELYFPNVWRLSDDDYEELTKGMLEYCRQQKYDYRHLYYAYSFALRFGNPLQFDPESLLTDIITAAEESVNNLKFDNALGMSISSGSLLVPEHKERVNKLYDALIHLNKVVRKSNDSDKRKLLWENFQEDPKSFVDRFMNKASNEFDVYFLNDFIPEITFKALDECGQDVVLQFTEGLRERYSFSHLNIDMEEDFLRGFKNVLKSESQKDTNGFMKMAVLMESIRKIDMILSQ